MSVWRLFSTVVIFVIVISPITAQAGSGYACEPSKARKDAAMICVAAHGGCYLLQKLAAQETQKTILNVACDVVTSKFTGEELNLPRALAGEAFNQCYQNASDEFLQDFCGLLVRIKKIDDFFNCIPIAERQCLRNWHNRNNADYKKVREYEEKLFAGGEYDGMSDEEIEKEERESQMLQDDALMPLIGKYEAYRKECNIQKEMSLYYPKLILYEGKEETFESVRAIKLMNCKNFTNINTQSSIRGYKVVDSEFHDYKVISYYVDWRYYSQEQKKFITGVTQVYLAFLVTDGVVGGLKDEVQRDCLYRLKFGSKLL